MFAKSILLLLALVPSFAVAQGGAAAPAEQEPAAGAARARGLLERSQRPQNRQRRTTGLLALYVRLADSDGNGTLSAAELSELPKLLGADESGAIDKDTALATLMRLGLDADGNGKVEGADLVAIFDTADTDRNGSISSEERSRRQGRPVMHQLAFYGVEAGEDGVIDVKEWSAHVRGSVDAESGELRVAAVRAWIQAAKADVTEASRRQVTIGVSLLTLESRLDADKNGRFDAKDLDAVLLVRDADKNGELSAEELAARVTQRSRGRDPRPPRRPDAPCLVPFQRSLEDALELQKITGQPLLICVNMDGEAASERLAWGDYRDERFAKLASGFICVIASPDRSNPFDYDDRGRRIVDRRFGRVIEAEHISIEPKLFERYFRGRRVAPRHVGVSPDGEVLFDIFLINDFSVLYESLEKHGKPDAAVAPASELSVRALLRSPDAGHREELERRMLNGRIEEQLQLGREALSNVRRTQHVELLRLALRSEDYAVREQAVLGATRAVGRVPVEFFPQLLLVADEFPWRRVALVEAMQAHAKQLEDGERKSTLSILARAGSATALGSRRLQAQRWLTGLVVLPLQRVRPLAESEREELVARVAELANQHEATPRDRELAHLYLRSLWRQVRLERLQQDPRIESLLGRMLEVADRLRQPGELDVVETSFRALALDAYRDPEAAMREALLALPLLHERPNAPEAGWLLSLLLRERARALRAAIAVREAIPELWVSELNDIGRVLRVHPQGLPADAMRHLQVLEDLKLQATQLRAVREALTRWPADGDLHGWFRHVVLRSLGAGRLDAAYAELPVAAEQQANFTWFHGFALLVAAEQQVQMRQQRSAESSYERCVQLMAQAMQLNPQFAATSRHYIAMAKAGLAELLMGSESWAAASEEITLSLQQSPGSADTKSGLGKSPRDVATALSQALARARRFELQRSLEVELQKLPAAGSGGGR